MHCMLLATLHRCLAQICSLMHQSWRAPAIGTPFLLLLLMARQPWLLDSLPPQQQPHLNSLCWGTTKCNPALNTGTLQQFTWLMLRQQEGSAILALRAACQWPTGVVASAVARGQVARS